MSYTKSQLKAISTIDRNLQIIACAGSGKTEVISRRIVEILKQKKSACVGPPNIVAFTFTEKAAGELKDRIHLHCREVLGTDRGLADMFIGTIHAYCLTLLQSPPQYDFLKYRVLDEVQQRLLIDRNSKKSGLTETPLLNGGHLERWKDSALYQQLLAILGEGKVEPKKIPRAVWEAFGKYHELLVEKKLLDYTKIIAEAVAELKTNATIKEKISNQLKYLVVDEYQDVNPLQESLIRELAGLGANVCVVGDDDQTIYQWRGSDVGNIITFSDRYGDVRQLPLNENFRSSRAIVETARRIAEKNNPDRLQKAMEHTDAQPYQRGDLLALGFKDPAAEAEWIARKIKSLLGAPFTDRKDSPPRGLTYSDFAILLRTVRRDAAPILAALDRNEIRYVVAGMDGLFDTPEVRAMSLVFFYLSDFAPKGGTSPTETDVRAALQSPRLGLPSGRLDAGMDFLKAKKTTIGDRMDAELYLQRLYLDFLEAIQIREVDINAAAGDASAGEIVFFNLGKFSQVVSDFEQIHFNTVPKDLYPSFSQFLHFQAPGYYPEGWEEAGLARPNAVQILTVHRAKGMQWPAVFVPALRKNRFPSKRQGGRSVWSILPEKAVTNADRYKGTIADERRLFYVALTRAEKYLFCTWAPIADNQQQRTVSDFFNDFTNSEHVLTKDPVVSTPPRIPEKPRREDITLNLSFSALKYYFECPYLFKIRFLYGFDTPVSRALGYGKSLHDALAEIHSESIAGRIPSGTDVPRLVDEHLHLPFANAQVEQSLRDAAHRALSGYINEHGKNLTKLEHVEKPIELKLDEGVVVSGRVDLIRRTDTEEVVIVDFKSDERAQKEDISQKQLHIYAVGYEQLTGKRPDLIEIHNLDKGGAIREQVDSTLLANTMDTVVEAGRNLRDNKLTRISSWCKTCEGCDMVGICRPRETAMSKKAA